MALAEFQPGRIQGLVELFFSDRIEAGTVFLDNEESGHCVRVLRHRPGDVISVIDGLGTLYSCELTVADAKGASACIIGSEPGFGVHPYRLEMAVCPTKNIDRFEWFAEKATEVGVDVIAPVLGDHSERRTVKTDRIRRIALSAAKQSLKAAVPEVPEPVSVMEYISSAPDGALKLICYCDSSLPREQRRSIADELDGTDRICILIGPEGDFSPEEVTAALESGWRPVHLGDSRLRTETAAVVAATAVYLSFMR